MLVVIMCKNCYIECSYQNTDIKLIKRIKHVIYCLFCKAVKREIFALLRCYAAYISGYIPTFRDKLGPSSRVILHCLTLEDGIDRLFRNVGK